MHIILMNVSSFIHRGISPWKGTIMELTSEYKCLSCSWSDHFQCDTSQEWLCCPVCGSNVVLIKRIPETSAISGMRKERAALALAADR